MRHFVVIAPSFIRDQIAGIGSRVTDADLNGSTPGSALVEVSEDGRPLDSKDVERVRLALAGAAPIAVAPIAPHQPNPTSPQALPGQAAGGLMLAGRDLPYVAAGSADESAASRVERLRSELAAAEAEAAAAPADALVPEPPVRRSGDAGRPPEPGPLDGSIPDLETHLGTINDLAEVQALREGEVAGKSRTGALAAIDARIAELDG